MKHRLFRRWRSECGATLIEGAFALPVLLLIGVCTFEFARAYQTWQVLTNAAREGARIASLPAVTDAAVRTRVETYASNGAVAAPPNGWTSAIGVVRNAAITIGGGVSATGSTVTVSYPFSFVVLSPVAELVNPSTTLGSAITLHATATMRNE